MNVSWDDHYPDQKILKKEVNYLCDAFVEVLLETIPKKEIAGIYFKGSAKKEWDSPLDYVPEISDIDIHLLFTDDTSIDRHLGTTEQAIDIQSKVEKRYFSKIARPYHIPRPQLMILNHILREENFISSPKSTISVLYGKEYPYSDKDETKIKEIDCKHILDEEEFISKFPLQIIDKPSKYLWQSLRNLVWHISPVGSRVLSMMGTKYAIAWGINRTRIVALLEKKGEKQLVNDYTQFYLSGWEYFLSKYSDTDAGRSAIIAGINTLNRAIQIAKSYISSLKLSNKSG